MKEFLTDKVLLVNAAALSVTTFMELQEILKILLLITSIIYTIYKMIYNHKGNPELEKQIKDILDKKDCNENGKV
jgi:hypothetical protein